jgi:AraC-like DNA-binding protein
MGRIGQARNWSERFAAMEFLIAERILEREPPGPASWVFARLATHDGRIAMRTLAAGAECSDRHLIALFRASVGLPPKAVARLFRFNRVVRLLNGFSPARAGELAGKPFIEVSKPEGLRMVVDWADIAAQSGYFDQSHFIKEFRRFAGATPAAFVRQVSDLG